MTRDEEIDFIRTSLASLTERVDNISEKIDKMADSQRRYEKRLRLMEALAFQIKMTFYGSNIGGGADITDGDI